MGNKKLKVIFVLFCLLFLSSNIKSQYINFTEPDNNETFYISSGTLRSIEVNWTKSDKFGTVSSYVVLETHNSTYSYISKPYTVNNVAPGTYTWELRLYNIDSTNNTTMDSDQVTFTVALGAYTMIAQNNFPGGEVKVGVNSSPITRPSPYPFSAQTNQTIYLEVIENQSYGGYNWIWNDTEAPLNTSEWLKIKSGNQTPVGNDITYNYPVTSNEDEATYAAELRKECNIIFSNQFSGSSEGGQMKVNGGTVAAPTSAYTVVEQNAINAEANWDYSFNGIRYDFQYWQNESGGQTTTFYPDAHKNYVAVYRGTPIFGDTNFRNLRFNTYSPLVERRVVLTWDEHPHTAVTQYQVWRHTKHNGVMTDPVLQTTVNRGTTTWTDIDFNIGPTGDDYQLYYDVRAYYSIEGTYSPENFLMCYGSDAQINKEGVEETNGELIVKEYSITNFPNPRLRYS